MKIEVLVATVNNNYKELAKKMNIRTDAIIANQCDRNNVIDYKYKNNNIKVLEFKEKGVGLNRNNALMRSTADICILADDDMTFIDEYEKIVYEVFKSNPDIDVAIFNLGGNERENINKLKKIKNHNFMKYGAARIAFRRQKLSYLGIYFNQNFGGGTEHNCGEDTIFLHSCLKNGLKIKHFPVKIANLDNSSKSTWFEGYNKKYFYDRGILHATLYNDKPPIYIKTINAIFLLKNSKIMLKNTSFSKSLSIMNEALIDFKKGRI